jgi:circadian clock protein KaiC
VDKGGERVRTLSVLKSRGMAHSSRTHRFEITSKGVQLELAPGEKA